MSKCDMLIICGLPRSGTTFLNNLFAIGAFGDKYYGHHSDSFGGLGKHPLHLCESQFIGIMFRNGVRLDAPLMLLNKFWVNEIKSHEKTIVYKHPQVILQTPFYQSRGFQIKYIFCRRDYVSWRESFIRVNGHFGIHKDSTDSHYEKYWGGAWQDPDHLDRRCGNVERGPDRGGRLPYPRFWLAALSRRRCELHQRRDLHRNCALPALWHRWDVAA